MDAGRIQVALEKADVIAAFRLHGRRGWKAWSFYVALSVVGLGLGWWILASPLFTGFMNIFGVIVISSTVWWWLMTIAFMLLLPFNLRRRIHKSGAALGSYELSWDTQHFMFASPATQSRKTWQELVKWRQNKRVFLIYFSKRVFWIVPRRIFLNDVEQASFEVLLQDRIGPENRPRPSVV
ncbi:MAG: YcxB family protein, partial [Gammaproteobacteria bacterium]